MLLSLCSSHPTIRKDNWRYDNEMHCIKEVINNGKTNNGR